MVSVALLALGLAGCESLDDPNQVVIRDAYDLAAVQREADQICAVRGEHAIFVTRENNPGPNSEHADDAPDAIYACVTSR